MYVDCTSPNIHALLKASSSENHTVQDIYKAGWIQDLRRGAPLRNGVINW